LLAAVEGGDGEVVALLLHFGADPNLGATTTTAAAATIPATATTASATASTTAAPATSSTGASQRSSKLNKAESKKKNPPKKEKKTKKPSAALLQSPLLFSVVSGCSVCAALLLEKGANCAVVVGSRAEPLTLVDLARRRRDFDMLQLLTSDAHGEACAVDLSQL
jgi:ankyrin repeat protein